MGRINPLCAIGIPTWGRVSMRWARAFRHLGGPLGSNIVELEPVVGKPIAAARNEIIQAAIANNCEFLFFLGDDNLPPGDAIVRLLQRAWDHPEIDLFTGVYWTKGWPTQPYLWRGMQRGPYHDWKVGEFIPVDYAGCDSLLIRLSDRVKDIGKDLPWFSTDWYWEPEQGAPSELATEDFYFYTRCRQAGIELWADTNVQVLHEDRQSGMLFGLTNDMPQAGGIEPDLPDAQTDAAPLVKLADLGCGEDEPYFGRADRVRVVRFDGNETIRPDYRCDLRHLPVPDESFDVVHSRHVLEHFGREEVVTVLKEWTRILRVGGEFRIGVPNLRYAMERIIEMDEGRAEADPYPWWQLYGRHDDERDFHKNGFTERRLAGLLEMLGTLDNIEVTVGQEGTNLYATATKKAHPVPFALTPAWDGIEQREGFTMDGLARPATVASAAVGTSPVADAPASDGAEPTGEVAPGAESASLPTNGHGEPEAVRLTVPAETFS